MTQPDAPARTRPSPPASPSTLEVTGPHAAGGGRAGRVVRAAALAAGPLAFALMLWAGPAGLTPPQRAVAALGAWMALWWLTECVPLSATALLPIAVLPLSGVCAVREATAPFADELIFVFLGGFLLGLGLEATGLHRRLALWAMLAAGTGPRGLLAGVMLATGVISMFVSNTATAVMMLPIAASLARVVEAGADEGGGWDARSVRNFGTSMVLGVAYAATIGGMATPIGTPPNLVMVGYAKENLGTPISFVQWGIVAAPVVALLLPLAWGLLVVMHPVRAAGLAGGRGYLRERRRELGSVTGPEWAVMVVFGLAVAGWVLRTPIVGWLGLTMKRGGKATDLLTDAVVAIGAAVALLVVPVPHGRGARMRPVLTWEQAERLPWGVLLLFGGGLSMAWAIGHTGLDGVLAGGLTGLNGWPAWAVLVVLAAAVTFGGELASNTAVATMLMPILGPAAKGMGMEPVGLLMAAALASSLGFVLPVATPPNALAYATGRVTAGQMARAGLALDLAGIAVVAGVMGTVGGWLMGVAGIR